MFILDLNDELYELSLTRRALLRLEQRGFRFDKIGEMPITAISTLLGAALKNAKPSCTDDEIEVLVDLAFAEYDSEDLINHLVELVNDVFTGAGGAKKKIQ